MTSQVDRAEGIHAKIERAKEHFRQLGSEVTEFLKSDPYRLVTERELDTGYHVIRVTVREKPTSPVGNDRWRCRP